MKDGIDGDPSGNSLPPLVLIVEDEPATAGWLAAFMDAAGSRSLVVATLAAARANWRTFNPDLILLDRSLPDGDGLDFAFEIRAVARCRIVIVTSQDSSTDRYAALAAGIDDYLLKPIRHDDLWRLIRLA